MAEYSVIRSQHFPSHDVYNDHYTLHTDAFMIKAETSTNLLYINMYIYRHLDNMIISNTTSVYLGYIIFTHEFLSMFFWDGVFSMEQSQIQLESDYSACNRNH